jgi:succinate dehydrogenase/fumarate reductase-like Fe-S protein
MDDSMFNTDSADRPDTVTVTLDGKPVALPTGMTVTAALFSIGETISRVSPASHKPCSPHCLMGVCFECMMEIDGVQRQACLTEVQADMVIDRHLNDDKGAVS